MTGEPTALSSGARTESLGVRLLAAFVGVTLVSVIALTVAAMVGTDQGLASAQRAERDRVAAQAARAAAAAWATAGTWAGADLSAAQAIATAAGAQLTVQDSASVNVLPGAGRGQGQGMGMGGPRHGTGGAGAVTAKVIVGEDQVVGTVRLGFGTVVVPGRQVAWGWVLGAGLVALTIALVVSWLVTRWLTAPLAALATAARAFARGDRTVRSNVVAPGELGEVGRAFDHLVDEVVRGETIRRQLAADVAHELRTPLAALQAGLEELRDGYAEPDTARLASLHDQALRLGRVVGDLADLSAAEAAALSLHLAAVDLAVIAAQALASSSPQLRAADLRVTADIQPQVLVRGDADRLHQAIGNLLANTARYCRPADQVRLTVRVEDGWAIVEVADTGPGIDAADLPHVFERLWRGPASRSVSGSGIGLAVVRELVGAHGGTVAAASPPGAGATFTLRLPCP